LLVYQLLYIFQKLGSGVPAFTLSGSGYFYDFLVDVREDIVAGDVPAAEMPRQGTRVVVLPRHFGPSPVSTTNLPYYPTYLTGKELPSRHDTA
jgi:hypothetical protein